MWIWLSLLLIQPQGDEAWKWPSIDRPMAEGGFQIYEKTKDGEFALVADIRGAPIQPVPGQRRILEVVHLRATYDTQPAEPGEKSQRLELTAERSLCDGVEKKIVPRGNVVVVGEDGTRLETSELEFRLAERRFQTDQRFLLTKPGLAVAGRKMVADDRLRQLTIEEDGWVEFVGRSGERSVAKASAGLPMVTRVCSKGPMSLKEIENQTVLLISAERGVTLEIVDETGSVEVTCDSANTAIHRGKWKEGESVRPEKLSASGNLRVEDSQGTQLTGSTLEWLRIDDTATITGLPYVVVERGKNKIRSRSVEVDRKAGVSIFREEVEADLVSDEANPRPIHVTAHKLTAREGRVGGIQQVVWVEAEDDVHLSGLMEEKGESATAECQSFRWDTQAQRGILRGGPWAEVWMGPHQLRAARILVPGPGSLVLEGPKGIHWVQIDSQGNRTTSWIGCRGDIEVETAARRIKMVDRCSVFSKDLRMIADRISVRLSADGKAIESILAFGHVDVRSSKASARLFGHQMNVVGDTMILRGWPRAVMVQPAMTADMAEIRFDSKTGRVDAFGGGKRIHMRFTEEKRP